MIDAELMKSKRSIRLVVAVLLMVVAVGIVSLVDRFSKAVVEVPALPNAPQKAPPPVSGKTPRTALPAPHSMVSAVSAPVPEPQAASAPVPEQVETPPPPAVRNVAPGVKESRAPSASNMPKAARKVERKAERKAEPAGDYTLQFGVFFSESNAERMLARLGDKGIRPSVDALLLAGPYSDRDGAEKDKQKLELDSDPIDLPGKGYVLKVGVFDSLANAQNYESKLRLDGFPVLTQTRIRAGFYGSRSAARDAALKLGIAAIVVKR
ncbi:MAG: SPOR domain-containing protein [Burkholderiales bacterium]|nr:SPOR domain-containing protein [Burkholderiales bacterium]